MKVIEVFTIFLRLGLTSFGGPIVLGSFAAWLGFTLPSALVLVFFAFGVSNL